MKKYECEICGKLFLLKSSLKVHVLNHKSYGVYWDIDKSHVKQIEETLPSCWRQEEDSIAYHNQEGVQELENADCTEKDKTQKCPFCGKLYALKSCLKTHMVKCKITSSAVEGTEMSPLRHHCTTSESHELDPDLKSLFPEDNEKFLVKQCDLISEDVSTGTFSHTLNAKRLSDTEQDLNTIDYPGKGLERKKTLVFGEPMNVNVALSSDNESTTKDVELFNIQVSESDKNRYARKCLRQSNTHNDSFCKEENVCKISSDCKHMCTLCHKRFVSDHALKKHKELQSTHCNKCSSSFQSCTPLKSVKKSHTDVVCPVCENIFSSEAMLSEHNEQRSHVCKVCSQSYSSCKDLSSHEKSHLEYEVGLHVVDALLVDALAHIKKERHHCEVCDINFASYEDAIIHKRSHSSKQRCSTCKKLFSTSSLLDRHLEQGSYKCNICKEVFTSCKDAKIHRKSHLRSRCRTCLKTFVTLEKDSHSCYACKKNLTSCKTLSVHRATRCKNCCPACQRLFLSEDLLREHMEQESYICEICQKDFTGCEHLKSHMENHKLRCKICKRQFLYPDSLKEHELKHSDEDLTCKYCHKKFKSLGNVKRHIERSHYGIKDVQCDICGKMFHKSVFKIHRRIHTGERPFHCIQCNATFVQKAHLTTHMKSHTGERNYPCNLCSKAFISKETLIIHQRYHTGEKPYECDQCRKRFRSSQLLANHCRTHSKERPFKCNICLKDFKFRTSLGQHTKTHFPDQLPCCKVCGKRFNYKYLLHAHYRRHSEEELQNAGMANMSSELEEKFHRPELKTFDCKYCGKNFYYKARLQSHERLHTGEKPHKCSFCEKAFRLPVSLKNHERIHTGERPYKCNICDKTFVQQVHLKVHMVMHTGARPYECSLCDKTFAHQSNLLAHRKIHLRITNADPVSAS